MPSDDSASQPRPTLTLEEVYRDHFDFVFRIARRMGASNRLDAEDVVQEVFLVVSRRLDSYDSRSAQITSWLYSITFNVVRARGRRRRLELLYRADLSDADSIAADTVNSAEVRDAWRVANRVLASMSPKKRDVFILAELEGLSCAEIAGIVGTREETVWSRLHYARKEFGEKLAALRARDGA